MVPHREPAHHILREMFDRVGVLENDKKYWKMARKFLVHLETSVGIIETNQKN